MVYLIQFPGNLQRNLYQSQKCRITVNLNRKFSNFGKSKNYHENAFTAFSPKSDETLSSAFSRLVRIFKQAYCDDQRDIHENEKRCWSHFSFQNLTLD